MRVYDGYETVYGARLTEREAARYNAISAEIEWHGSKNIAYVDMLRNERHMIAAKRGI